MEHQTLIKDLSPLATGNTFQAKRRDPLPNDRKVSSSSWHSLVRLGGSPHIRIHSFFKVAEGYDPILSPRN